MRSCFCHTLNDRTDFFSTQPTYHLSFFLCESAKNRKSSLDRDNGEELNLLFIPSQWRISQETRSKPEIPFAVQNLAKEKELS